MDEPGPVPTVQRPRSFDPSPAVVPAPARQKSSGHFAVCRGTPFEEKKAPVSRRGRAPRATQPKEQTQISTNPSKPTRVDRKARNAKVIAGADKDLAKTSPILIAGEAFDLPSLKAVFSDDTAAIDAADAAKKAAEAAVLLERTTGTRARKVFSGLRAMLLSNFGPAAVALLGDFGVNPPRSRAAKTVVTKAVGVAKAKATRVARGTKGPVARTAVVGTVDAEAIESAINAPAKPLIAPAEPAATAPAAVPAPASPAPTPAGPGTPPKS